MKMEKLIYVLLFISLLACETNNEEKNITYRISDNESGFSVTYKNEAGELVSENVITNSMEDIWQYNFDTKEGEIIYVSANYKDINTGIIVEILIDGKVFKQSESLYDTLNFVTVSGTVPYE